MCVILGYFPVDLMQVINIFFFCCFNCAIRKDNGGNRAEVGWASQIDEDNISR